MTGILVTIGRTSRINFRWNYLKNRKLFFQFFIAFLKSASNFEFFEKEDEALSLGIPEIIDSERCG